MYDITVKTNLGEYFYSGSCLIKNNVVIVVFTRNGSSRLEFRKSSIGYGREVITPHNSCIEILEQVEINGKKIYSNTKKY